MEIGGIYTMAQKLSALWREKGFSSNDVSISMTSLNFKNKLFELIDFRVFYSIVDGMDLIYPNDCDDNGFLIYPFTEIKNANNYLKTDIYDNCFIFGDFLHACWQYGVKIIGRDEYEVLLIKNKNEYSVISNSLEDFLMKYINKDESLYP